MSDSRFFTPMVSSSTGHIFVNDFVKIITGNGFRIAKVKTFFKKVRLAWMHFTEDMRAMFVCTQEGCAGIFLKVVPLHLEIGDIYVIREDEEVVSLEDVVSTSPIPDPNNLFKGDSNDFLCQLDQNVWASIMFCMCMSIMCIPYRIMNVLLLNIH